ncbi:MAG: hypothetical protein GC178_06865 [Flavobacteriales bacterium]|nr:hypothetical protein [Flavobacteriales bacterium]
MKNFTFIFLSCLFVLSSNLSAQGLKSSTSLYVQNGAVLYVENSMSSETGGVIYNQGEIHVTNDFNNSGTDHIDGMVVLDGSGNQSITGVSRFYGVLEVNKTGGIATVTGGTTNVHGQLRLAEGTMNANGNLVIASTPTETGLVDDFSDPSYDGTLSGNLRVQRYISGNAGFHYIGSAVNTASVSELSELGLYGPDGGQVIPQPDCNAYAVDASSPYGALLEWHENGPWLVSGCIQSGWFVRSSGSMTNGRGYAAIVPSGQTIEIGGSVGNTSEITTVAYSGLANTNATGDGWHMVSNPFPSPMQWYASPAGFDAQAQLWVTSGSYTGTYQPVLPSATNPAALIGSQQGFFVRSSGGPASFALPQTYRRLGDPTFYKEEIENLFDIVVEAGEFADKTRVRFGDQGETNGFDSMLDANKLKAPGAQPTLKTRFRGVDYSINSLPMEGHPMTIPMDLIPGISGQFKFTAKYLDQFTVEAHVYLEDLKLNKIQELTINPVYDFFADESDDPERFLLHFRLGDEEPMYTGDDILMYASDHNAYLFLPELKGKASLEVFNAIGEIVYQTSSLVEGKNAFDLSYLATGAYVMRAIINDKPISKKVIL